MKSSRVMHAVSYSAIVAVAAVLLYFSLRGIHWKLVAGTIASIRPGYAALSFALGISTMFVRAARWRILLEAQAPVSFKTAFWATSAGYFGNNFLPARGGELVRSYIVRQRSTLSGSYVLATALSERVADAVALVLIGAMVLPFAPEAAPWMKAAGSSFLVIGVGGTGGLACLPMFERPAARLLQRWPRTGNVVQQILQGVRSLHAWRRLVSFIALTAATWLLDAVATVTLAHALSIVMPLSVAMLLIVGLSLSSALPSTPGYVGVYQFVAVMVLKPFGISQSAAIAFILVTQALSYVLTGILGMLAMTRFTPVSWQAFRRPLQPIHTQS